MVHRISVPRKELALTHLRIWLELIGFDVTLVCLKPEFLRAFSTLHHILTLLPTYLPLISQVRGPYGKLWTEFFSFLLSPKRKACGP